MTFRPSSHFYPPSRTPYHGTLARNTHIRTTYLSTLTMGFEVKLLIVAVEVRQAVYVLPLAELPLWPTLRIFLVSDSG
jgi:hypothetical protein